ncbi:hypothetical protein SISSUDRAFT_1044744 [Sistotremastrum suecicum HHB10207 ss-3]|uniref:Uncharacterized protein n=1 Tax=Sistotremastrum suecicum HHB10207 ss-3 TaxID=1314776 RepID=A0A166EZT4_9AGAM|nr:hypothetical protein SISSUDRAFT_1044744 [Sistotremastrum suecicum HHB10207 ss-3]
MDSLLLLFVSLAFSLVVLIVKRRSKATLSEPQNELVHVNKAEAPDFRYPAIQPLVDFDFDKTQPPPYRPFKWGPVYFISITMAIRPMEFTEWIELDNQFRSYHRIRSHRVATKGTDAVRTLPARDGVPSGALAAKELVHELSEYLSRRYPHVYRVERKPAQKDDFGWYNEGEIKTIEIIPIGVTYDLERDDPMTISGLLIQDDLALMLEGKDGRYYFQAGSVCTPGFWRIKDKIGLPLDEIHTRGNVPQYESKLQNSLAKFFQKMRVDKPVTRNNYFFQIVHDQSDERRVDSIDPDELAWSETTNGDEDAWDHSNQRADPTPPATKPENVRFRTERQSLRRLPRSGAIVFTVRTYLEPIVKLAQEPGVPGRMAAAIRSWPPDVAL